MTSLYVTDLDGTLLNNGSFVSNRSAEIINDLTSDGALITVATARTPATVVPLMEGLRTTVPYIVMTGAATFDPVRRRFGSVRTIKENDCRILYRLFDEGSVSPFVYHLQSDERLTVWHSIEMNEFEREFYTHRANLKLKKFTFEKWEGTDENVVSFFALGMQSEIIPLADRIAATGKFSVSCFPDIFRVDVFLLEVFSAGVSKAEAVKDLFVRSGADRLVVFGDNLNDLPMMGIADVAVAVSNALPRVRDYADIVIGPNYDDAVAEFMLEDFYRRQ